MSDTVDTSTHNGDRHTESERRFGVYLAGLRGRLASGEVPYGDPYPQDIGASGSGRGGFKVRLRKSLAAVPFSRAWWDGLTGQGGGSGEGESE